MRYWLMKSEPNEFGLDDLKQRPKQTEPWDGVRNYQARNFMRDEMRMGDPVFFYHSNCKEPAIVGIAEVASQAYPDPTAFDPEDPHYDPKSDPDNPRWYLVDIRFKRELERPLTLKTIKAHAGNLEGLHLIRRGNRLSVMPVSAEHWKYLLSLESAHDD